MLDVHDELLLAIKLKLDREICIQRRDELVKQEREMEVKAEVKCAKCSSERLEFIPSQVHKGSWECEACGLKMSAQNSKGLYVFAIVILALYLGGCVFGLGYWINAATSGELSSSDGFKFLVGSCILSTICLVGSVINVRRPEVLPISE